MREKKYFPLFVDLTEEKILVVGAGEVGLRRARILAEFGAQVTVQAPDAGEKLLGEAAAQSQPGDSVRGDGEGLKLPDAGSIRVRARAFREGDLDGFDRVLAATPDRELNAHIAGLCRERGIPVNNAGDRSQCDFYFPAIAGTDGLVIGICSSGRDHAKVRSFAARLREWLKSGS